MPAPLVIVEGATPTALVLEAREASLPAAPAKSKVKNWAKIKFEDKRSAKSKAFFIMELYNVDK